MEGDSQSCHGGDMKPHVFTVLDAAYFFSLLFVTLTLFPLGAHLLELPAKMKLAADDYRTVQQIYRGWAWTGAIVFGALVSTGFLSAELRGQRALFNPALLAFAAVALSQVVFWTITFPVNRKTENWTQLPDDWMALRGRWEYSHAISAILVLIAAMALFTSVLRRSSAGLPS